MTKRNPGGPADEPGKAANRPAARRVRRPSPPESPTGRSPWSQAPRDESGRTGSKGPGRRRPLRLVTGPFRLWSAFCVVAFVLSLFAARLVQLQGVDEEDYAQLAVEKGSQTITLEAPRAPIFDRDGVELAETVNASKLVADPTYTRAHAAEIAAVLHRSLHLDYLSTVAALRKTDTHYSLLADHLTPAKATATVDRLDKMGLAGVYTQHDTMRIYPAGNVASNLMGYVGWDGKGAYGVEGTQNALLQGHNGHATYQVVDGQIIPLAGSTVVEPKQGTGVRLTIDEDLQFLAQRRLAEAVRGARAESGAAIVMDTHTGQVLALADYPTFDSNDYAKADVSDFGSRALEDAYEPGSVEKVLTFSALINEGYVTPTTKVVVPPVIYADGATLHDDFAHGVLHLTTSGVLAESSNLGMIRSASAMPNAQLYSYLKKFGLDTPLDLGVGPISPGMLAPPSTWAQVTRDDIDFGQGVSVDALQMAAAINTVANRGEYVTPSLIQGTVASNGEFTPAPRPARHRVVSPATSHAVTEMMEDVIAAPGGTGPMAAIKGYQVAGKTGTAQRASADGGGYHNGYTVSFAGFAPAADPRFTVYVVIQRPLAADAFGGNTAGPVFHDLLSAALQKYGVPPTPGKPQPLPPTTW